MDFSNKVVLITGAGSGIGEATAVAFAKLSANLALFDINKESLSNVSKHCEKLSKNKVKQCVVNVTIDKELQKAVEETIVEYQKIDVVVNSAGIFPLGNIVDSNAMENFDRTMNVNFRSIVSLSNLVAPSLVRSKGNIINISSTSGIIPSAVWSPYSVSKAALSHFTKCLALELASKGVRANAILPGPVKTNILIHSELVTEKNNPKFWDNLGKTTPLGHCTEPEEIADLIVYLASDRARSITGAEYAVDCGILLVGERDCNFE